MMHEGEYSQDKYQDKGEEWDKGKGEEWGKGEGEELECVVALREGPGLG